MEKPTGHAWVLHVKNASRVAPPVDGNMASVGPCLAVVRCFQCGLLEFFTVCSLSIRNFVSRGHLLHVKPVALPFPGIYFISVGQHGECNVSALIQAWLPSLFRVVVLIGNRVVKKSLQPATNETIVESDRDVCPDRKLCAWLKNGFC